MSLWKKTNQIINSSFTYLDSGGEKTIFEIIGSSKTYISQIILDLVNMTQNGTVKLYSKIDGTNYREIKSYSFTVLTDSDGLIIDLKIPINKTFKITYSEGIDEGADRIIPYNYVLEG